MQHDRYSALSTIAMAAERRSAVSATLCCFILGTPRHLQATEYQVGIYIKRAK